MEMTTRSTRHASNRRFFIGGSDARIIMGADEETSNHDSCRVQHGEEKGQKAERADRHNQPQNFNQHPYTTITGGMPLRWHTAALCYWTIVILLGWYPWNILLMLLSLPAMDFSRRDQTALCRDRCLADTEAPR
jgi:hypothetical protein